MRTLATKNLATTGLERLNAFIQRGCVTLQMMLLGVIVLILFSSVFWRYFLNDPFSWSEDAALFCMVWMTFLGAPVALRGGDHVAMELCLQLFPGKIITMIRVLINFIVLTTSSVVIYYGWGFVEQGMARIIPSLDWLSQGYVYLALPVGFLLMIPVSTENIIKALSNSHAMAGGE